MSKEISTKELTEIIVNAIREEQYFSKDVLIPKIRALIRVFRLRLESSNYVKIITPTETAKLIRSNEIHNSEKDFWKQELKNIVGNSEMQRYYDKLDLEREKWGVEIKNKARTAKAA